MSLFILFKSITKREWVIIFVAWLITITASLIPFLFSKVWLQQGYVISGVQALNYLDIHYFYSLIIQIKEGAFFVDNLYSISTFSFLQLRPSWLLVGWWASIWHLTPVVAFYSFKVIATLFLLVVIYIFLKLFFDQFVWRIIAFFNVIFTMGFGFWLIVLLQTIAPHSALLYNNWPLDIGAPEAFIFLSILASPHLVISWTLLIGIYLLWFLFIQENITQHQRFIYGLSIGILTAILFIDHPYHILPVSLIIGLHVLWLFFYKKQLFHKLIESLLIIILLAAGGIFYHLFLMNFDWLTRVKILQNNVVTPAWWVILVSYGFFILGAIWQIKKYVLEKNIDVKHIFLIIWFFVHLVLILIPSFLQRRFIQGWQLPLVILSFFYFQNLYKKIQADNRKKLIFIFILLVIFLLPSPLYSVARNIIYYRANTPHTYIYYSPEMYAAYQELLKPQYFQSVLLAHPVNANFIPGVTGRRVIAGHWSESVYFDSTAKLVELFFQTNIPAEHKKMWLKELGITHIFYSEYEKSLGNFDLNSTNFLELVYENQGVKIYKIK